MYSIFLPPVILTHPTSRKVFQDDRAYFYCITTDSSTIHWRLNGTNLLNQQHDDLVISSTQTDLSDVLELIILASAEYDGTKVQCVAETDDNSVVSNTAVLRVQGLLYAILKF